MTEAEYLDAQRFPLTTQSKLSLRQQMLIDAVNRDDLDRLVEDGKPLSSRQQSILKELREKAAFRPAAGDQGG